MFGFRCIVIAAALLGPVPALASKPAPPTIAVAQSEPPASVDKTSLEDWTARAERGDSIALKQLCELHFEGRGGAFDAAATVSWCRRAADLGDPAAMQRLGLLYLAGIGTAKDLEAAARLCTQAASQDTAVATGFCLAAVAEERQRGGLPPIAAAAASTPGTDAVPAATVNQWRDRTAQGDRAATERLCEFYFGARGSAFVPATAVDWCRRAARNGDAAAMWRLGLMRLWGVGIDKSASQAETLCAEAQARDPVAPASFCIAAIKEERARAASAAAPSHFAHAAPRSGGPPAADVFGLDRALASVHVTATGLQFSCRDMLRWSRYDGSDGLGVLTPETRVFGRSILEYQERDYAELDRGAVDCVAAIAPYDRDGSDRRHLAEFRKMLPLMQARQRDLDKQKQARSGDVQRCVEALRRSRAVAHQLGQVDPLSADAFSCTSAGNSQPVGVDPPPPGRQQRPAAAVR